MADGSRSKRHHHVPRFYLARWGDRLTVRRRDGACYPATPKDVAVICGFYDLRDDDGVVSAEVERFLGEEVEDPAAVAFAALDESGVPPAVGSEERRALAALIAFQMTRTPETRARILMADSVKKFLDGRELTMELMSDYLETQHLGFRPTEREARAAVAFVGYQLHHLGVGTHEESMHVMYRTAVNLIPVLAQMHWTLATDRKERIVTADEPVRLWRRPHDRKPFEGVGVATAAEIRFPIDPSRVLMLRHEERPPSVRLSTEQVQLLNLDLATSCHHFLVGSSRHERWLRSLHLAERGPALRFDIGPGLTRDDDGEWVEAGEVLHLWSEDV